MIDSRLQRKKYMTLAMLMVLIFACAVFVPTLQNSLGGQKSRLTEKTTMFYLPSLPFLKILSLGFERLIADFFWIKAVTYTETDALDKVFVMNDADMHEYLEAQPVSRMARYRVYQMLTAATNFDPKFLYAYEFGGTMLAWGGQVDLADDLLRRGYDNNRNDPAAWKIVQTLAFNLFFFKKDYAGAAGYMKEVARLTGGKTRANDTVVTLYLASHRYDAAIRILQQLRDRATDTDTRSYYDEKLKYATVEKDLNYLNRALHVFMNRYHVMPLKLDAMVTLKIIPSVPIEPFGGVYLINTADKKVENKPYRRHRVIATLEDDAKRAEPLASFGPSIPAHAKPHLIKDDHETGHKP